MKFCHTVNNISLDDANAPLKSLDYILVKRRFLSGVNIHRTRSFPEADIGIDHDLMMMTFRARLKKARKPNQPRLIVWGQIRENVLKNEYAKHVGYKQFVIFHQN